MELSIKWKDKGKWELFPVDDIMFLPRSHALDLFSRGIPVIILQDLNFISNDKDMLRQYRNDPRKLNVIELDKIEHSDGLLRNIGFV